MGLTQRAVLVIFKERQVVKKRISVVHLCIIIVLFFIPLEAMAGTYIYYNEKGEEVSSIHKNETQHLDKANPESVQPIDTDKIIRRKNNNEQDNDQTDSAPQGIDPHGKNQKDNKKP